MDITDEGNAGLLGPQVFEFKNERISYITEEDLPRM